MVSSSVISVLVSRAYGKLKEKASSVYGLICESWLVNDIPLARSCHSIPSYDSSTVPHK